jgi:hypothetical protein
MRERVHFHCAVIDGVFQPDAEGRLGFREAVARATVRPCNPRAAPSVARLPPGALAQRRLAEPKRRHRSAARRMVGDYISASFLAGQQRVLNGFAIGFEPPSAGTFDEPTFSALEKVRGGTNHADKPKVLFTGGVPEIDTTF